MENDPQLSALIAQAARNLDTLELLVRSTGEGDAEELATLRQRLQRLKRAYASETEMLTRAVLAREVERRRTPERRRSAALDG